MTIFSFFFNIAAFRSRDYTLPMENSEEPPDFCQTGPRLEKAGIYLGPEW
jgi:hypothetical protein